MAVETVPNVDRHPAVARGSSAPRTRSSSSATKATKPGFVKTFVERAALELEAVDVVQLRVVAVEPDEHRLRVVLVDVDEAGLDSFEGREVANRPRGKVDVVQVPVLVAAHVLQVEDAAIVRGPEEDADAAVAVVRDHAVVVDADGSSHATCCSETPSASRRESRPTALGSPGSPPLTGCSTSGSGRSAPTTTGW